MTAVHPDRAAFRASICAEPDDDTRRLAFADWCDENGDPNRAEFIRVQCRIARGFTVGDYCIHLHNNPCRCLACVTTARSDTLLAKHKATWIRGPVCDQCRGSGQYAEGVPAKEECRHCFGTGDSGGLLWKFWYGLGVGGYDGELVRVEFKRGFPDSVKVPLLGDVCDHRCPRCGAGVSEASQAENGSMFCGCGADLKWLPTSWLSAVLRDHPVVSVVMLANDRYLSAPEYTGNGFIWRSSSLFDHACVPKEFCPDDSYTTRELAVAALGTTIAKWGRNLLT